MTLHTLYFTILDRRTIERQRKLIRNREDATDVLPEVAQALAPELNVDVERLLSLLTPEERQVVHFKFFQGMKHAEIGRLLNLSEGQVGQVVFRAIAMLRKNLDS